MSTIVLDPLLYHCGKGKQRFQRCPKFNPLKSCSSFTYCTNKLLYRGRRTFFNRNSCRLPVLRASSTNAGLLEPFESTDVLLTETFFVKRTEKVYGLYLMIWDCFCFSSHCSSGFICGICFVAAGKCISLLVP